jgi:diguanylate cyclase (GGDEF)-like protein
MDRMMLSDMPLPAAQFDSVARATPPAMLGHCINTTIAAVAFVKVASPWELALWSTYSFAIAVHVLMRRMRVEHTAARDATPRSTQSLELRAILFAVALGLPWTYLALRYLGAIPQSAETVLISLGVGMAASGAVLLAPIPRAALTYMSVVLLPTAVLCIFGLGTPQYLLLGALAISCWFFLFALVKTTSNLYRSKSQAIVDLTHALAEARTARAQIEHAALHDPLTEVPNRRAFMLRLNAAVTRASETGCASWAVLLMDLDRFKIVNDTLGHKSGDDLLMQVASRLRMCMRPGDLVARLGGDEFAIVAAGIRDVGDAEEIALRLLREFDRPFLVCNRSVSVGISIGIAVPFSAQMDSEQIIRCADLAMYEAKAAGSNRFKVFELEMQDRMDARSAVEMGLRQAVGKGELELYFQPIYTLADLKLVRFEALLRWRHPDKGLLPPSEFLPIAEEIGFIAEIGQWVVQEACRQAASWPSDIEVAVNFSPIQVNHTGVVELVERALARSALEPRRLEIEITETALLSDTQQTLQQLERLKQLGVRLSMDDFGTGYSSLSYLATFPLHGIKIDKGFIGRFSERSENAEIMRAMVDLARALNRSSTVEGIETVAQLSAAQALGATYGQGYYFSRPVPGAQAHALATAPHASRRTG